MSSAQEVYPEADCVESVLAGFLNQTPSAASLAELKRHVNFRAILTDLVSPTLNESQLTLRLQVLKRCLAFQEIVYEIYSDPKMHEVLSEISRSPLDKIRRALLETFVNIVDAAFSEASTITDTEAEQPHAKLWIEAKRLKFFNCLPNLVVDPNIGIADGTVRLIKKSVEVDSMLLKIGYCEKSNLSPTNEMLDDPFFASLKTLSESQNTELSIRALDAAVEIGSVDSVIFTKCLASGLYGKVLGIIKSDDVLAQLNCLHMLSTLSTSPSGVAFLVDQSLDRLLVEMLEDPILDSSAHSHVLLALSAIAKCSADHKRTDEEALRIIEHSGGALSLCLKEILTDPKSSSRIGALFAWMNLSTISQRVSQRMREQQPKLSKQAADLMRSNDADISVTSIRCWASILSFDLSSQANIDANAMIDNLVIPIATEVFSSRPFAAHREVFYSLFKAVASRMETIIKLLQSKSVFAVFCDPFSETEYQSRIAKHDFAVELCTLYKDNATFKTEIGPQIWSEVERLKRDGPFYVPSGTNAQVEKATQ